MLCCVVLSCCNSLRGVIVLLSTFAPQDTTSISMHNLFHNTKSNHHNSPIVAFVHESRHQRLISPILAKICPQTPISRTPILNAVTTNRLHSITIAAWLIEYRADELSIEPSFDLYWVPKHPLLVVEHCEFRWFLDLVKMKMWLMAWRAKLQWPILTIARCSLPTPYEHHCGWRFWNQRYEWQDITPVDQWLRAGAEIWLFDRCRDHTRWILAI